MKKILREYKIYFTNKEFVLSFIMAFLLLTASLITNYHAGSYATEIASNSVTDVILSNLPVFNVNGIFIYGSLLFWIFIAHLCFSKPRRMPYIGKAIALFVFTRSAFVTLTHIGPFPTQIAINSNILNKITFGADLFFSGHVGLPFLMALVFWQNIRLRILFIITAIIFAVVVLLAHVHYSIDVLSAFFITYAIVDAAKFLFKRDLRIFQDGISNDGRIL